MKRCVDCGKKKAEGEFHLADKKTGRRQLHCKLCSSKRVKKWRQENPERQREIARRNRNDLNTRLKLEMIEAYGGACTCCGEDDPHFLTVEHKDGVGDEDRRPDGRRSPTATVIMRLRREGWPDSCTVLCYNCNCCLGRFGFCPHQPHEPEQRRY